jgi:hypothetical protein
MKRSIGAGEPVFSDLVCGVLLGYQNDVRCQNKAQQTDAMDAFHGLHHNRPRKFGWMIGVISHYTHRPGSDNDMRG